MDKSGERLTVTLFILLCLFGCTRTVKVGSSGGTSCGDIQILNETDAVVPNHSEMWTGDPDLARYRKAVGPPAIVIPKASSAGDGTLAIVTWNVGVGAGRIEDFVAQTLGGQHFVLLLEEAFRAGACVPPDYDSDAGTPKRISPPHPDRDIVSIAKTNGWWLYYVPSMRNGRETGPQSQDRGNAILSDLPLSDLQAIELPYEYQRRVAVTSLVAVRQDVQVRVVAVHLDTRTRFWQGWYFRGGAARARQWRELISKIKEEPAVSLGGDFNGGVPARRACLDEREDCHGTTHRMLGFIPRKLDHLLVHIPQGWTVGACSKQERFGSDHWGLSIVIHTP